MIKVPNIRHLQVFLEVVEYKSISKASEKVFLSQPAITQAIAKLETELDTRLFERRSDGMYATESGEAFAYRVGRALELIQGGIKSALRAGASQTTQQADRLVYLVTTTQLRALIAVSAAKNFSIAGRNLGVSQSSLHRAARDLEGLLAIVLFEKSSTGISASKAAGILAKATKLAFSEISQGQDEVNAIHCREIGRIVIGSMPLARTSILPKAIIEFSQSYPDFTISVDDGPYDDLLNHLRHADIDVLIGALRFPPPSDDVMQEELFSSAIEIVGRAGHPLCSAKGAITPDDLARYAWVVPRVGTPTREIFGTIFTEANVAVPERLVETSSQSLIRSLLLESDRLTLIHAHQFQSELNTGALKTVPYNLKHFFRSIGLTLRKSWKPTAAQLFFMNSLRKNARVMDEVRE